MPNYYNEFAPFPAQWLRHLMRDGHLDQGTVDERSIADVRADDLAGFRRCHFFAGIGGWELALRLAGWPDDREVWTGSCPCPPFSSAGKKHACPECGGKRPVPCPRRTGHFICVECEHAWHADGRHLWPEFWRLIRDRRPPVVFGEQVAGADGRVWLAGVRATLERIGYAVGAADLAAAGVAAPHIRQRLFWVAYADGRRWEAGRGPDARVEATMRGKRFLDAAAHGGTGRLADGNGQRLEACGAGRSERAGDAWREGSRYSEAAARAGRAGRMGDADNDGREAGRSPTATMGYGRSALADGSFGGLSDSSRVGRREDERHVDRTARGGESSGHAADGGEPSRLRHPLGAGLEGHAGHVDDGHEPGRLGADAGGSVAAPVRDGDWDAFDVLPFADGKSRRVEPVLKPVADGLPGSLGPIGPAHVEAIEKEVIDYAASNNVHPGQVLRALWEDLSASAVQRPFGRPDSVRSPSVLLAFLCQLAEQGWRLADAIARPSAEAVAAEMRVLRPVEESSRTPCERRRVRQSAGEHSDVVRELSQMVARHAEEAWGEAFRSRAEATFPLAQRVANRVGRISAYGNAIVPALAAEFIAAFLEAEALTESEARHAVA